MSNQYGPRIVTNGLVLCLDAGNSKSYSGSGTTWTDLSGNNNHGTLVNGPTYNSDNKGSIVFDGSNDYINCGSSLLLNRPFSINCWVYFTSLVGWQTSVGQDTSLSTLLAAFYFQKVSNTHSGGDGRAANTFGMTITNTSGSQIFCYDTIVIQSGVWYNYCVSISSNSLILYRNGNIVQTTNNSQTMAPATGNLLIGASYYIDSLVDYTNGRISQTSIYNRSLSANEVLQNYNATKGRYNL